MQAIIKYIIFNSSKEFEDWQSSQYSKLTITKILSISPIHYSSSTHYSNTIIAPGIPEYCESNHTTSIFITYIEEESNVNPS